MERKASFEQAARKERKRPLTPAGLVAVIRGFFARLFYIVRLVYETSPAMLFLMALFCLLDGVLPVLSALLSKYLLDEVALLLSGAFSSGEASSLSLFLSEKLFGEFRAVTWLLFFYFLLLLLRRLLARGSAIVNNLSGELVINHIRLKIMNKAKEIDIASFDRPEFYEKLENANREAGVRPLGILRASFSFISATVSAVSFIVILSGLHPLAPPIMILLAVPVAVVNCIFRHKTFHYLRHHSKERREMNYFSGQAVDKNRAKEVRITGIADDLIGRYESAFSRYFKGMRRLILKEGFWQIVTGFLSLLGHFALFVYVVYRVVYGIGGSIGDYSLYTGALSSISGYVTTIVTSLTSIYEGTLFIDNMLVFLAEKREVVPSITPPRSISREGRHTIELRHVSFSYPGSDREVLKDINLTLKTGDTLVLVGLNGAGKTTLIKLMSRLYDPTDGVILLDGHDIREYDTEALYALYGIIFQDFGCYAVTAAENIAFGDVRRPVTEEEVIAAAEKGGAARFIEALPRGYSTPLMRIFEEEGTELSGGQWQKLSLARAFYKDSAVLVLDEPTASLDPLAEEAVFEEFGAAGQDRITVLVSHRLSGATSASAIAVLEGGRLIEYGNHEELMAKENGRYRHLFSVQAKRYAGMDYEHIPEEE